MPDLDASKASTQLYKAIHQLRETFAAVSDTGGMAVGNSGTAEWLTSSRDSIGLSAPGGVSTDIGRFETATRQTLQSRRAAELEQAFALYRGDLLPMDRYTDWTELPRDHLGQRYLDLLLVLGESRMERGELSAAAENWRLALSRSPTLEAAHCGLMELFSRQGQRDRALKQYGLCMDALADEFGVSPSEATRSLSERIERRQVEPAAAPILSSRRWPCSPISRRTAC